ncbi:MAG: type 4a pilus biogenesis protein PilO [Candidatus Sungbacteria bacterium]|nr:type 4a pilus biogenesis protein PilO [Candidatus Sungbacteria bacterium]
MTRFVFSIIFLFISVVVFFSGVFPAWQKVTDLQVEIAEFTALNDELQDIAGVRDELMGQYNSISQTDLNKLSAMVPRGLGSAQFVRDIEALAKRHGMFLRSIDFVSQEKPTTSQLKLPTERQVIPVDVSLKMLGSYESFGAFLRDLEKTVRIVDVADISFGTRQQDAREGPLEFSLNAATYYSR